jgi:uncharacterized integral membrane protein
MREIWKSGLQAIRTHPRHAVMFVLGTLLSTFILQNTAKVELQFLFWTFESRRVVIIGFSLIIGLVIGWLYGRAHVERRNRTVERPPRDVVVDEHPNNKS